jgi:arylsulfatase A-like enzyme
MEIKANPNGYSSPEFLDPDWWRQYRWAYFRLVEKVDQQIGRILDTLRETGLDQETVVIFSSDHGEGLGAHQWKQKKLLYQEAVNIPFIIRPPKCRSAGTVNPSLVSNGLDLLPTICEYAGITPPEDLPGTSLVPVLEGTGAFERDFVPAETALAGYRGIMVRTRQYKYTLYSHGRYREQLHDLETDPGEMLNLARCARFNGILQEHRRRALKWCRSTNDTFGGYSYFPGQPMVPGEEFFNTYTGTARVILPGLSSSHPRNRQWDGGRCLPRF